jgi:hypothetical protein
MSDHRMRNAKHSPFAAIIFESRSSIGLPCKEHQPDACLWHGSTVTLSLKAALAPESLLVIPCWFAVADIARVGTEFAVSHHPVMLYA